MTSGYRAQVDGIPMISKSAVAVLDYPFDWATDGWLASGETIVDHAFVVTAGLTIQSHSIVGGTIAMIWLAGGTLGSVYTVTCNITTSAGRQDGRSMRVKIVLR